MGKIRVEKQAPLKSSKFRNQNAVSITEYKSQVLKSGFVSATIPYYLLFRYFARR